jgi:HSP20 family protein
MKLIRWSPLEEMGVLRDQIDRIFEPVSLNGDTHRLGQTLAVEVTETEQHYRVRALIPGLDPEALQLQVTEKTLMLSGETRPRELEKEEILHLNEIPTGQFSKKLTFPQAIAPDHVEASVELGILDICLPKAQNTRSRNIEIKIKS